MNIKKSLIYFSFYLYNDEFLELEGFYKFYLDIIIDKNKLKQIIRIINYKELSI